jgi:pimeloyl-ACP methyl ester carboxylesterase
VDPFRFTLLSAGPYDLPTILRGPDTGPCVLFLPPLFEEMNRTRRLLADLGRALAASGIGSLLPDLPGTGDAAGTPDVAAWQTATAHLIEALAQRPLRVVAVRGGALLTDGSGSQGLYRISPAASGASLLREMMRAQAIADQEREGVRVSPSAYETRFARGETVALTGYDFTPALAAQLTTLTLPDAAVPLRISPVEGPPVWRQAEPAPAPAFAAALAEDIAAWMR